MRLADVLEGIAVVEGSLGSLGIGGISIDSRRTRAGDLFVALPGGRADGHSFLPAAAQAGAAAALVEREVASPPLPCVRVDSTTGALPLAAVRFYGDPSARLKVIGVTGTNGKTTVTYLLESILAAAGNRTGVIGSINYRLGGAVLRTGLTTPFPHELQEVAAAAEKDGATHLVMEVSSHSAAQGRIAGMRFDAGLFLNLSHDHLDFHGDMETYFRAKARFFRDFLPAGGKKAGIAVNGDDRYGAALAREFPDAMTFGFSRRRTVHPVAMNMNWEGTNLVLATPEGRLAMRAKIVGAHNVSNIMAAVCGAMLVGVPAAAICEGVERLPAVPGRLEAIPNDRGIHVFVDYAHTPDGLDHALTALGGLAEARLITVFGCGGDRDRAKRPEMGRVAALRSDVVVATSDNPRSEDPAAILEEIVPGIVGAGFRAAEGSADPGEYGVYLVIPDRRSAIAKALAIARPGDTIAIAGKGHENVQIIGDRSLPFDDREVVRSILAGRG